MKKIIAVITLVLISAVGFANCENAYASAGYSLSHAKKSMEANNFEHQQYYAERALKAFEKVRDQNESCGCPGAKDPILDGIENLNTALNQDKWDNGRFFTKKALENAEQVLNNLDMCTTGREPDKKEVKEENNMGEPAEEHSPVEDSMAGEEWEAKLNLKKSAEEELAALEKSVLELAVLLDCDKARQIFRERKTRTEAELQAESLSAIRSFYRSQVVALHNKALFAMLECSKK